VKNLEMKDSDFPEITGGAKILVKMIVPKRMGWFLTAC